MTTAELINALRSIDPEGLRPVIMASQPKADGYLINEPVKDVDRSRRGDAVVLLDY